MSENSVYDTPKSELLKTREGDIFAKGKVVIYDKDVAWPERCYKCNKPTTEKVHVTLTYLNPWFYLSILVSILLLIILGLIFRKRFPLDLPICEEHLQKHKKHKLVNWCLAGLTVLAFTLGFVLNIEAAIGTGLVLILALVVSLIAVRMVAVSKLNESQLWVRGVGKPFAESLPDYE